MTKKDTIIATVIGGLIVSAVSIFIFTPLGNTIFKENDNSKTSTKQKDSVFIENAELKTDSVDSTKNDTNNIYYLQSHRPVEIYNGDLIVTLNNTIQYMNQNIELKIIKKSNGLMETMKDKKVGDILLFDDYIITFLSLENNISTYDLRIKIEKTPPNNL